ERDGRFVRADANRVRAIDDLEICRHQEQRRIRFIAYEVGELENVLAGPWISQFAVNHSLEFRRGPDFRHNIDGPGVADFTGWDRVRGADPTDENAFHRLRPEVLRMHMRIA